MSLWLNEILTQVNNVKLLQNTLLRYARQEYRLQDMANNPSALLSTGNASARVCYVTLGKDFMKAVCQLENVQQKTMIMISKDDLGKISGQSSPFNIKESEAEITDG